MAAQSRRDNFNQSVINILFKRSGGKCCMCGATTFGPHTGRHDKYQNIGQAAHITAAAPGGPRYDPKMPPEVRMSAKNGIWLCSNCHSLIDRDTKAYPLHKLFQLKKEGEERARQEVGVATVFPGVDRVDDTADFLEAAVSASTIVEIRKTKAAFLQLHNQKIKKADAETFLDGIGFINLAVDMYRPQVGTELVDFFSKLATYCTDAEINLEAIRQFQLTLDKFASKWDQHEVELVANTLYAMTNTFTKRSTVHRSACALLKDMSRNKALASKKLDSIPLELLRDIQRGKYKRGSDYVDYEGKTPPPTRHSASGTGNVHSDSTQDSTQEDTTARGGAERQTEGGLEYVDYIDCMVELAQASEEKTRQLESKLADMGFEPNIV